MASNQGNDGDAPLNVIQFDPARCLSQEQSPFFSIIPGELRNHIFYFALSDYEDKSRLYDMNTCYRRPGYFGPRRTDTALLRTCQRIYNEAWHLPWASAVHTLFLTSGERAPPKRTTPHHLRKALSLIHSLHGDVTVDHLHVFAQLYALEQGDRLQPVLDTPHFNPVCVTLTIRHTDWWWWENDAPLRINSTFVNKCRFPQSVKRVCLELESIERRKGQIDFMAAEMAKKWQFMRNDGVALAVREGEAPEVMQWTGSSTWNGSRWLADEAREEELDYYVLTVSFTPVRKAKPSEESEEEETAHVSPSLEVRNVAPSSVRMNRSILQSELRRAGIPRGTPAAEALEAYTNFTQNILNTARCRVRGNRNNPNQAQGANLPGFQPQAANGQIPSVSANTTTRQLPPQLPPRLPQQIAQQFGQPLPLQPPPQLPPHPRIHGPQPLRPVGTAPPPLPPHPRLQGSNTTTQNGSNSQNTPSSETDQPLIRQRLRSWLGGGKKQSPSNRR